MVLQEEEEGTAIPTMTTPPPTRIRSASTSSPPPRPSSQTRGSLRQRPRTLSFDEVSLRRTRRPNSNPRSRHESPLGMNWHRYNIHQDPDDPDNRLRWQRQQAAREQAEAEARAAEEARTQPYDRRDVLAEEVARRIARVNQGQGTTTTTTPVGGAVGNLRTGAGVQTTLTPRTIVPLGGRSIVTTPPPLRPLPQTNTTQPTRSLKQNKPGKRKQQRYDNNAFVGIAAELARGSGGVKMAQLFERAQLEEGRFRQPHCPLHYRSVFENMTKAAQQHLHDQSLDSMNNLQKHHHQRYLQVGERFVKGEVAATTLTTPASGGNEKMYSKGGTGEAMYQRLDSRLRLVLSRVVASSDQQQQQQQCVDGEGLEKQNQRRVSKAVQLLDGYELFLASIFNKKIMATKQKNNDMVENDEHSEHEHSKEEETEKAVKEMQNKVQRETQGLWDQVLLRPPHVTSTVSKKAPNDKTTKKKKKKVKEKTTVEFAFNDSIKPTSSLHANKNKSNQAAFYRLLLHAVCQFHGLHSESSAAGESRSESRDAGDCRVVRVRGSPCHGWKYRLVDHVI